MTTPRWSRADGWPREVETKEVQLVEEEMSEVGDEDATISVQWSDGRVDELPLVREDLPEVFSCDADVGPEWSLNPTWTTTLGRLGPDTFVLQSGGDEEQEYIVVRGPTWAAVGVAVGVAGSPGLASAILRDHGYEQPDPRPGDADGVDVSWSMDVDEAQVAELLRWLGASARGGHSS